VTTQRNDEEHLHSHF